jgi:hypothetical protein
MLKHLLDIDFLFKSLQGEKPKGNAFVCCHGEGKHPNEMSLLEVIGWENT